MSTLVVELNELMSKVFVIKVNLCHFEIILKSEVNKI